MKLRSLITLILLSVCTLALAQGADNPNNIASIDIEGNKRIATETYLYYISVKVGSPYDESILKEDFTRLWQTGFLEDLKIESQRTPKGVNVIFHVKERALIKGITYTGNKKVSSDDIHKKLTDDNLAIKLDQPFDPSIAQQVTNALEKLMLEKGLQFGTVSYKLEPINDTMANLDFVMDEGPKVKIGEIDFEGNHVFSDGKLKNAMKQTKEHWMFSWITRHDDFEKEKFEKDKEKVQDLYFNNGYINARIDDPEVQLLQNKKRMKMTIPVSEGQQYKTGNITFAGNTVFETSRLAPFIPLKKGQVFNRSLLKKGLEDIQKLYGDEGYIYTSVGPVLDPDDANKVINLTMQVDENERFYVNRIEFTGNTYTLDKVIRREMRLQEGDLLRVQKFKDSLDRIYRLGYFDDLKPNITPVPDKKNLADISLDVRENKRNEIQLGGGYSQIDGFFGNVAFQTKNLFGSGKTFGIQIQGGSRAENYSVSLAEPYVRDTNISAGVSLFRTKYDYISYIREDTGGSITFGFPLFEQVRSAVTYSYDVININQASGVTVPVDNPLFPGYTFFTGDHTESRLIPQIIRTTVNNPIDPSRGTRLVAAFEYAGGIFGGDLNYYKPTIFYTLYWKGIAPKQYSAVNVGTGIAEGYGGQELPFFERFYLGGDQSIRGYESRIVAPIAVDPVTKQQFIAGGNKFFQLNLEYVIGLIGPLKVAGFMDYGNAFSKGDPIDFSNMRGSTGAELRFNVPMLSAPFRFIYAINFNRGDLMTLPESSRPKKTVFRFSVGTTF